MQDGIFEDESMQDSADNAKQIEEEIFDHIAHGRTFLAYDIGIDALDKYKENISIIQGVATALLKTGAIAQAKRLIAPVVEKMSNYLPEYLDENTIVIMRRLAEMFKESWKNTKDSSDISQARDMYSKIFAANPDPDRRWKGASSGFPAAPVPPAGRRAARSGARFRFQRLY